MSKKRQIKLTVMKRSEADERPEKKERERGGEREAQGKKGKEINFDY